jgi:hypothetical protein
VRECAKARKEIAQQTERKREVSEAQEAMKETVRRAIAKLIQGEVAKKFMDPREFKGGDRLKRACVADIVEYANSYKSIKPSQFPFEEEGSILYKKFDRNQSPLTL